MYYNTISLVIVQYGHMDFLLRLIDSLKRHEDSSMIDEIVIVNNDVTPLRLELGTLPTIPLRVLCNYNNAYATAVNQGVALSAGEIVVVANNDIMWSSWPVLRSLLKELNSKEDVGVVGPQLVYPDGTWQRSYGYFPSIKEGIMGCLMLDFLVYLLRRYFFRLNRWRAGSYEVEYVDGAFMVIRRKCWEELGGFDESFKFYAEDADFCFRAWKKGWKVIFVPEARVIHFRGATSMSSKETARKYLELLIQAKRQFVQKHYGTCITKWYMKLMEISTYERMILYHLCRWLTKSEWLNEKAFRMRLQLEAIKSLKEEI
ncbi:MAG: glycosyltransferase family 2 protein [Candidatus Bathyarchaeia archaeon]